MRITGTLACALVASAPALLGAGCDRVVKTPPPAPARVERASKELELASVILQPESDERLGISARLARAERRAVPSTRTLPGVVVAAPGGEAVVLAPLAGVVALVTSGELPLPGSAVAEGEVLLHLAPVLTAADRIALTASLADAEGQVARAKVDVESAEIAFRRVEPLVAERALAGRALEDARATLDAARASLGAAVARRDTIAGSTGTLGAAPVPLASPIRGVVRALLVSPGETVAAGARVAEVVALTPLRVRVAVPRAEHEELDPAQPARVRSLESHGISRPSLEARLVPRPPPTVGLLPGSIDLLFELDNAARVFLPGERVAVELRRRVDEHALVVPWSSVVQDALGGQWVYVSAAPATYVRARVFVERVEGDLAVLDASSAVDEGAQVVTAGAAELFGIEFGVGQ